MNPIRQMLVALAVCGIALAIGFCLVSTGTAKEQATITEQPAPTTTTTTTVITTTTTTAPQLQYFTNVPLSHELQDYIISTCRDYAVDPAIVMAMIKKESNYNPDNIGDGGESYGLMQVQPKWHSKRMQKLGCTHLLDPYHNVTVAIDYLAELLVKYDGDYGKALTAYNQGSYRGTVTDYAKAVLNNAERIGGVQ